MEIDQNIIDYYNLDREDNRLNGLSLEKLRTQALMKRYLPSEPLDILDVGGGTGVYSFWLHQLGHHVSLIDAMPIHIEKARKYAIEHHMNLDSIELGDARSLPYKDDSFDMVLLLGPLYHLTVKEDRLKALAEAKRVLKLGGFIFAAAISRFASMMDGYYHNFVQDPDFLTIMRRDLKDGQHRNHTEKRYFTNAFFHHPKELEEEIVQSGFSLEKIVGIESFAAYIPNLAEKLKEPAYLQHLFETIDTVEADPSIMGMSPHILAIGKKQ